MSNYFRRFAKRSWRSREFRRQLVGFVAFNAWQQRGAIVAGIRSGIQVASSRAAQQDSSVNFRAARITPRQVISKVTRVTGFG